MNPANVSQPPTSGLLRLTGTSSVVDAMQVNYGQAEAEFERILRQNRFLTASLKAITLASSMEDGSALFVILPDILAIDDEGQGWCFEVNRNTDGSLPA
jgi:hypothetical protein